MDPPAPPPDQVRPTQVNGGEIPTSQNLQHLKQSPSKGIKKTQQKAILKQRKDGSVRLIYSTKTDIKYIKYEDRQKLQPVPKEFDMFGLTNLQWNNFLLSDSTILDKISYGVVANV